MRSYVINKDEPTNFFILIYSHFINIINSVQELSSIYNNHVGHNLNVRKNVK